MSEPISDFQTTPSPAAPPPPEGPIMSTMATVTGIFFEPGEVFQSFRGRPRFLVAAILCVIFFMAFQITFVQKVGYDRIVRESVENAPRADQMTPEQKEGAIRMQSGPIVRAIGLVATPVVFGIFFALGAALYLLGAMLMGKPMTFSRTLAVWVYSSLPVLAVSMLINILLIFLKSPDDYDIVSASRRGLVKANLSFLADPKTAAVLYTFLGSIDIFAFYGLFLAALGLRKVGKMSTGSAWGIVLGIWIFGLVVRIAIAAVFGQAM